MHFRPRVPGAGPTNRRASPWRDRRPPSQGCRDRPPRAVSRKRERRRGEPRKPTHFRAQVRRPTPAMGGRTRRTRPRPGPRSGTRYIVHFPSPANLKGAGAKEASAAAAPRAMGCGARVRNAWASGLGVPGFMAFTYELHMNRTGSGHCRASYVKHM